MFKTEHSTYLLWFELIDLLCVRLYRIFAPSNFCNLSLSMASRCSFLSFYTIKAVGKVGGRAIGNTQQVFILLIFILIL